MHRQAPDDAVTAPKHGAVAPVIAAVHLCVPGRLRLKLRSLHRNLATKQALETVLRGREGIVLVSANIWSGNLLLLYERERRTADIVRAVRHALQLTAPAAVAASLPREGEEPGGAWWTLDGDKALAALGSAAQSGLSTSEASARRAQYGANILPTGPRRSDVAILLGQFKSLPILLLMGSTVLSIATGGFLDAALVTGVILANAMIGFGTERGAERTIESLALLHRPTALVRRDGDVQHLPAEDVVPGDMVVLLPGTMPAADARIIDAHELSADESALTGESLPVAKHADAIPSATLALAERANMVFRGTSISSGHGLALVVGTGTRTEIGRINALVAAAERPRTPMQQQIDRLGRQLTVGSLGFCGLAFVIGLWRGLGVIEMLRNTAALAVAAIPEGLPTVATTTLALGIRDMQRRNVLVRRLDAVETLGAVSVMCFDKTGTLTVNRMAVSAIVANNERFAHRDGRFLYAGSETDAAAHPSLIELLEVAALCNESVIERDASGFTLKGSPTENALLATAIAAGLDIEAVRRTHPVSRSLYRSEQRVFMATVHATADGSFIAVKGNPSEVLALCRREVRAGKPKRLGKGRRAAIEAENQEMASQGLRVLGFAYAKCPPGAAGEVKDLVWLGLVGMADPTRPGMRELMRTFHQAGIRTVMITGDQGATAYAVAKELELSPAAATGILDGPSIDRSAPDALAALAPRIDVFARVSPTHKLEIVRALQKAERVVAMTGDGINDGPALRVADIGVAMGRSGTDAAREIADIVLADDELQTMVVAVRHGRTIYRNIRKSVHFLVATNGGELVVNLTSLAVGGGQALSPVQLLWLNLVHDLAPALALGIEPPEADVMAVPPRERRQPIVGGRDYGRIAFESSLIGAGGLAAHLYGLVRFGPLGGGLGLTTLVFAQALHAISCRSESRILFRRPRLPPNRHLVYASAGVAALHLAMSLLPPTRSILGLAPVNPLDLAVVGTAAGLPFVISEATKAAPLRTPPAATATPAMAEENTDAR